MKHIGENFYLYRDFIEFIIGDEVKGFKKLPKKVSELAIDYESTYFYLFKCDKMSYKITLV